MLNSNLSTYRSGALNRTESPIRSASPRRGIRSLASVAWLARAVLCGVVLYVASLILFSAGAGSTGVWASEGVVHLTVLAAGDLRGEIKPCGCSPEGQMGGLARRMTYLASPPETSPDGTAPIVVDLGNNLPKPSPQGALKTTLINRLWAKPLPDAVLPGPNELAAGAETMPEAFPWVAGNDTVGKRFLPFRTRTRRFGGRTMRIGIYGYISPNQVYQGSQSVFQLEGVTPALLKRWRNTIARESHQVTLLLFRGDDAELEELTRSGLFDLIIAGNPSANELQQITRREVGKTVWPQVPTKGQGFLRVNLPMAWGEKRPGDRPEWEVDWLTDAYRDHPDAAPAFAEYDGEVKALFFARLTTMEKQQKESPFAGAETCAVCHPVEQQTWQASRHAGALKTLQKVGKQFDPECLACHVTGLEQGGFLSEDLTPKLGGVQCENCHGPGRVHVAKPTEPLTPFPASPGHDASNPDTATPVAALLPPARTKPDERTCRSCHVGSHSPTFDFATYWAKVRHGKTKF